MTKAIRKRRAKPRRRESPQEDAAWWEWATQQLLTRCGFRCERCGHDLGNNLERHHRIRRQVGGDRLSNLLALHSLCHRYITEHPTEAESQGWIVSTHGPAGTPDPSQAKVRIGGFWYLRDDHGGKRLLP